MDIIKDDIEKSLKENFFCDDSLKTLKRDKIEKLFNNDIILLENIRFYEEETSNDIGFQKKLLV